jgi:hypothetical protein
VAEFVLGTVRVSAGSARRLGRTRRYSAMAREGMLQSVRPRRTGLAPWPSA